MNGNSGIQPTIELATTNGNGYPYAVPAYGMGNGGFGNGFGGDGWWLLILIAILGFGNNGFGGFGGNNNDFAWLSNGQKDIMNNTSDGFNSLHISNQIDGVRDGVNNLATQLCGSTADIVSAVNNGFSNAEISANARQIADMNQNFNNQIATLQGFNGVQSQLAQCCCENRLATQDLKSTVISENCSDREVLRQIGQEILVNQTANTQKIIDEIFRDRLDEKDSKIADLQREISMKDLQASQIAQNAFISNSLNSEIDLMYNRLVNCPIPSTPVYGRTPIFTCNGCGCNGTNQFI